MKMKDYKEHKRQQGRRRRFLTGMLVLCLLLNYLSIHSIPAYAAKEDAVTFVVGGGVSAVLKDGTLTLSGQGNTEDYSAQTAPFLSHTGEIHTLVIEEGVTYLGAYLFYGLGELGGELVLPGSVTGFGDYVFSGKDIENAPKFTIIRNQFVSAQVTEQIQPEAGTTEEIPAENQVSQNEVPAAEEENVVTPESAIDSEAAEETGTQETIPQQGEAADEVDNPEIQDMMPQEPAQEEPVPQEGGQTEDTVQTRTITQQEATHPETFFVTGQTGFAICTDENGTFAAGAQSAGYQVSDSSVKLVLDDTVETELPLADGQVCLPECPKEIIEAHGEDEFTSYEFAGWSQTVPDGNENVIAAGQYISADGAEQMSLYSVWNTVSKYQIKTKAALEGSTALYTLSNGDAEKELAAPEGYVFFYQWQMAENSEEEMNWTDIDGAAGPVYERMVEGEDANRQFRCKVTAVKQTRSRDAAEPVTLYSEGVNAAVEVHTVYVKQIGGNDESGNGTEATPFRTLTKAAKKLQEVNPTGTVDTNKIVLLADYTMNDESPQTSAGENQGKVFSGIEVAATISGGDSKYTLTGGAIKKESNGSISEVTIDASGDLKLENITIPLAHHIYGNGNNITFGENVDSSGSYLYGAGRDTLTTKVGKIKVESGKIIRIVGYVRSRASTDANHKEANITITGGTVESIIAGSASGEIKNANVNISIKGGKVTRIVGGNQGFSTTSSPFSGKTVIQVSGGTITDIYGAGTGRNVSIPTYLGELDIQVTGGEISNIYGAGSAAYVISNDVTESKVKIHASGGTIGNIFAAGKGNDTAVTGDYSGKTIGELPKEFGSLTGAAEITIDGTAEVRGNIYSSGQGDTGKIADYAGDGLQKNAYLKGDATITVTGGTVKGNIYGGGRGINKDGYEECARVEDGSTVKIIVSGGTVEGSVYGGGEIGKIAGDTEVSITGGTVQGAVFGGGENGPVSGNTKVQISGGTVVGNIYGGSKHAEVGKKTHVAIIGGTMESAVYGGALGEKDKIFVKEGITVNMTGGWVKGNLYGGSEISNDGSGTDGDKNDLIFVNFTGGVVGRNVFGGGYMGKVYGSTHVHIGEKAPDSCKYYQGEGSSEKPKLSSSKLLVSGSVYAGGDFGGDGTDYNTITVTGTSHVYVDGEGYDTGAADAAGPEMEIAGGVFGSGASCDAGSTRVVTLRKYGSFENGDTTRKLTAIQRADRVLLLNSHVRLSGQTDIANANPTAPYSLNRIGDHDTVTADEIGQLGRGLVLQGGSTVILDSEAIGLSRFSSVDKDGNAVTAEKIKDTPNRIQFDAGTVFRVAYTKEGDSALTYGEVSGYAYMQAGEMAEAFAYARMNTGEGAGDGGFVNDEGKEINSYSGEDKIYRYWQMRTENAVSTRETVLTARELTSGEPGYVDADYGIAAGVIELPQTTAATQYEVKSVTIPTDSGLQLVEAAENNLKDKSWVSSEQNSEQSSGNSINVEEEKEKILANPLTHFGLFMSSGEGFESAGSVFGKVVSQKAAVANDANTMIASKTGNSKKDVTPEIEFYLTYSNKNITASKELGTVIIRLEGIAGSTKSTIDMKVRIVTRAAALSDQTVELYATQGGNYNGKLTIPAGASRDLTLTGVEALTTTGGDGGLVSYNNENLSGHQFGINMQTVESTDWEKNDLTTPKDLYGFSTSISIGTTDSRYDAELQFNLRNAPNFSPKEADKVILTFTDQDGGTAGITLKINWLESIVSKVALAGGREYSGSGTGQNVTISPKSAVTSHFTIGRTVNANTVSLELKDVDGQEVKGIPAGTKLTLLNGNEFYYYEMTGEEKNVPLNSFKKMWESGTPTGNITANSIWSVILDFSTAKSVLNPGNYSLRLREEVGADTQSDSFTVDNSKPAVTISSAQSSGMSRGEYSFTLSASADSDTRFSGGSMAVLIPESGTAFPAGTMVQYKDEADTLHFAYPRGGRIYLPMTSSSRTFTMNTLDTAGLGTGEQAFKALLMPCGINAGAKGVTLESGQMSIDVSPNPETGFAISRQDAGTRVVKALDKLEFTAAYTSAETVSRIDVKAQKKMGEAYSDITLWNVTGNTVFAGGTLSDITVTVPKGIEAGTYRILFTLGEQQVPYNVIVE